jgi:hypothetical protein
VTATRDEEVSNHSGFRNPGTHRTIYNRANSTGSIGQTHQLPQPPLRSLQTKIVITVKILPYQDFTVNTPGLSAYGAAKKTAHKSMIVKEEHVRYLRVICTLSAIK